MQEIATLMIDRRLLLSDFDRSVERLKRKGVEEASLVEVRDLLETRRTLTRQVDETRAALRARSEAIGQLLRAGKKDEAESAKKEVAEIRDRAAAIDADLTRVEEQIDYILLRTPNFPDDDAPVGRGEEDNIVLRTHNYDAGAYAGRTFRPHWEIAEALGLMDVERAGKVSGSMFTVLRGDGAKLLRALVQFGLSLHGETYEEILPPHFVRTETFTATGQLPKFEAEAYKLRDDDLWAIPTGEVPLMGLHRDEMLAEEDLPKHYMAYTVCFRREAGSAGKDTRGMQRLHEFHKVELVKLCVPERERAEFASLLADCERPLQALGLPYRIVDLCTADLTFSSARIHDIEVYAPGADKWLEVSSVGMFTDYQARRGNIRFKRTSGGKPEFVHALNGSGLATPRLWAAILEHGLQEDGTVRVPDALTPFLGKAVIGKQERAAVR
jgi:seryl-tRNA synthetase